MTGVGAYPGSFNPPTVAHVAIAEAALAHAGLDRIDLIVSRLPLGKEAVARPRLADRLAVLEAVVARRPGLAVRLTDAQLVADVAEGYDVLIVGADKWAQINDPSWYGGSVAARDSAVGRLPRVLIAPRGRQPVVGERLDIPDDHLPVSSTAARGGRREWMAAAAVAFDDETGAWSDCERYEAWLADDRARTGREANTADQ
jgi:nicotinic acid mononucleotide adenylyltransferase